MKGLERDVSDPLKTKIRALKTDMIRIQDFHNDHLMLRRAISFACGDELVLQLATFAYWGTKVTLTLTFNIKCGHQLRHH